MGDEKRDIVDDVEVTAADIEYYDTVVRSAFKGREGSVTLTFGEWGYVVSRLRLAMLHDARPGVSRVVHDRLYAQVQGQVGEQRS